MLGSQLLLAAYFSLVHQGGTVAAMDWLAAQPRVQSALFLMPCHSTPFYSHMHRPIPMTFLDCSPPGWAEHVAELNVADPSAVVDPMLTSDELKRNPANVLRRALQGGDAARRPSHIVMFDKIVEADGVAALLKEGAYELVAAFFHSHFAVDHNGLQQQVLLFAVVADEQQRQKH